MDNGATQRIPILVELTPGVLDILADSGVSAISRHLATGVLGILAETGINAVPTIDVRPGPPAPVISLTVHGIPRTISLHSFDNAWWSILPPGLVDPESGDGWPRVFQALSDWLVSFDPEEQPATSDLDPAILASFVTTSVLDALREYPGWLIDAPDAVSAIDSLQRLRISLLELGVSMANAAAFQETGRFTQDLGLAPEDATELVFSRSRADRVKILIHPAYLEDLYDEGGRSGIAPIHDDNAADVPADELESLGRDVTQAFGVLPPPLVWMTDRDMPHETIAVKINDVVGTRFSGLRAHNVMTRGAIGEIRQTAEGAYPAPLFILGGDNALVSSEHRQDLELDSFPCWDPMSYARMIIGEELKWRAYRLLDIDDVEYRLALLAERYPDLVAAVMDRYSTGDLTRTFRRLLQQGQTLVDLRTILNRLLQFDTAPVDPEKYVLYDDRLPVNPDEQGTPRRPETSGIRAERYANYIRRHLGTSRTA